MDFKIVCTDQEPIIEPKSHAHIVAVGIDNSSDGYADLKHEKEKVINNIKNGTDRYYTVGNRSGKLAFVEVVYCGYCIDEEIIRSTPDATEDNNLDYIRRCRWE